MHLEQRSSSPKVEGIIRGVGGVGDVDYLEGAIFMFQGVDLFLLFFHSKLRCF